MGLSIAFASKIYNFHSLQVVFDKWMAVNG